MIARPRRARRGIILLILFASILSCRPGLAADEPDKVAIERRIGELEIRRQQSSEAGDDVAALAAVRSMAAIDPDHPKPYLNLVLLQSRLHALDKAPSLMQSLGGAEGPGPIYGDGLLLFFDRKFDEAGSALKRALKLYEGTGHAAGIAACLTVLGNIDLRQNRLEEAAARYDLARQHLERIGDRLGLASALANLAKVERLSGRPGIAAEKQREILEIREELGDREGQARTWNEIGGCLFETGDVAGGVRAYASALVLRREMGDRAGEVSTLRLLAADLEAAGEATASLARLEEALAAAEGPSDPDGAARIRLGMGRLSAGLRDYPRARLLLSEALAALDSEKDRSLVAEVRYWLAVSLRHLGEFAGATANLEAGLEEAAKAGSRAWKAALLTERGVVRLATGDPVGAMEDQERAAVLNREEGNRRGELTNLNNLGAAYRVLGDMDRARRDLEKALRIAEELGDKEALARGHNNVGVLLLAAGEAEEAIEEISLADAFWKDLGDERGMAMAGANLAEGQAAVGKRREATAGFDASLEVYRRIQDRRGEAATLNQMGAFLLRGGDPAAAAKAHAEALEIAERFGLSEEAWMGESGLGMALDALGRGGSALEHALRALDRVEETRAGLVVDTFKVGFMAAKLPLYERALELMLRPGPGRASRAEDALQVAERARARGLLDILSEASVVPEGRVAPELRQSFDAAGDRLSVATIALASAASEKEMVAAREALDLAEEGMERQRVALRRADPAYGDLVDSRPAGVEAIRAALGAGEVLLEYFVGESDAWLWQIDRATVRVEALPPPSEILGDVRRLIAAIAEPGAAVIGKSRDFEVAARLGERILPGEELDRARRLIIVADGPLHHLPFDALVRNGHRLLEDFEIVVAPSASTLVLMRGRPGSSRADGFLGIGGAPAVASDARFLDLPFAAREVERIAGLFPEDHRWTLTGEDATVAALMGAPHDRARYLHFAVHGWLDDRDLRHSGLILASDAEGDGPGILAVSDVFGLRLAADVVTLSACRSGVGEIMGGEGILGMTRAFLAAGARSLVVSLWSVNDASTGDFMERFYREMQAGETPAGSLREAKLAFMRSDRPLRRQPYLWAPFVLVGDPGRRGGALP